MTRTVSQEKALLSLAVDRFAAHMKDSLWAQVDKGNYGWNDTDNATHIAVAMVHDAVNELAWSDGCKFVDIANRAMFLWVQSNGSPDTLDLCEVSIGAPVPD